MKTKINNRFILILVYLIFVSLNSSNAQQNCSTAFQLVNDTSNTYQITGNEFWFKFSATSTHVTLNIFNSQTTPNAPVDFMILYTGNCASLVPIDTAFLYQYDSIIKCEDFRCAKTNIVYISFLSRFKLNTVSQTKWSICHNHKSSDHIGHGIFCCQSKRQ